MALLQNPHPPSSFQELQGGAFRGAFVDLESQTWEGLKNNRDGPPLHLQVHLVLLRNYDAYEHKVTSTDSDSDTALGIQEGGEDHR